MAIFTDEEYADTARIRRGSERFHQTIVPYVLSEPYMALKHVIFFHGKQYNHEINFQFSVLDGVDEMVNAPDKIPNSIDYLQRLVDGKQDLLESVKPVEVLQLLYDEASKPENNNHATMYVLSPSRDLIIGVLDLKDGVLTANYRPLNIVGENSWKIRSTDELFEVVRGETRFATCALFEVNNLLEKTNAFVASPVIPIEGPYSVKYDIPIMLDGNIFREEVLEEDANRFRSETLTKPVARNMCLMATQDWVEPNYIFTSNVPNFQTLDSIVGVDRNVEGNCVEQSVALAINYNGGIGGKKVFPRFRVKPSLKSLRKPVPDFHLDDFDPLSEQTTSNRLFGVPPMLNGDGAIEDQNITELGATVKVPLHQFYTKKDGSGYDVYDSALRFFGSSKLYEQYLKSRGMASYVQAVTHFAEIDKTKSDFYDKCRQGYRNEQVYSRARAIFTDMIPSQRSEYLLFSAWNQALSEHPELVASAFGLDMDSHERVTTDDGKVPSIESQAIDQMLLSQEVGFVCVERITPPSDTKTFATIFKENDHIFVSCGQDGTYVPASNERIYGEQTHAEFKVHSFGGNNFERMKSIHSKGCEKVVGVEAPGR